MLESGFVDGLEVTFLHVPLKVTASVEVSDDEHELLCFNEFGAFDY